MTFRKNMVLIVGGSIAGVLLLITLFMLFRFRSKYEGVNADLRASQQRLDSLYARDPFPSEENVLLVQGSGFNWPQPDHLRIVFLPHEDDLIDALGRFGRFLERYRRRGK